MTLINLDNFKIRATIFSSHRNQNTQDSNNKTCMPQQQQEDQHQQQQQHTASLVHIHSSPMSSNRAEVLLERSIGPTEYNSQRDKELDDDMRMIMLITHDW
jgi:hypothetical protein